MLPTLVHLVTCSALPDGEEWAGTTCLPDAFAARGIDHRWVVWDDPTVDWAAADLVAVRSTWDYDSRREEFLDWARSVTSPMLNGVDVFAWNTDKAYLTQLAAASVPIVPTTVVERHTNLAAAVGAVGRAVVKPSVGAGGRGLVVAQGPLDEAQLLAAGPGPWVVQPLVESVRTEGETTVFVLAGEAVSQAVKRPAGDEIRVHERYGGATYAMELTDEAARLALVAVDAAEQLLGTALDYARVDMMRLDSGELVVSELEATEPGLYLEVLPQNAAAFVDLVATVLGTAPTS